MSNENKSQKQADVAAPAAPRSQPIAIRTRVRAGLEPGERMQHSQALTVRTRVQAGLDMLGTNHTQALTVRTRVRAGLDGLSLNHSQAVAQAG